MGTRRKAVPVVFLFGGGAGFVILGVLVHFPEIVELGVGQNIFHAQHRGHHGVVLIVVFVHAVAADEMQIRITIVEFFANGRDMRGVIVVVNRIRFLLPNDAAVEHVAFLGQADLHQLALGQFDQIFVFRIPEAVVLETEIFEAVTSFVGIRHHLGRPGTEVLDAADFDARVVDVNPVVIERVAVFQDQHDGEEVAVLQAFRRPQRILGNWWR